MSSVVVSQTGLVDVLILCGLLVLIFVFLLKLYNILNGSRVYDISLSIILLAVGTFCYLFIEVGFMLTIAKDVEETLLAEYNIYFWIARLVIVLTWVFWFAELILYSVRKSIEALDADKLTRMQKRRFNRSQY